MNYMLDFISLLFPIPTLSQDFHWQWVFLLEGDFHIIQKIKTLVRKLETEADLRMYLESVADCLFLC